MSKHFIYVADPMCSWCWGFSPVIGQIHETFGTRAPVRVMVGGLRPGTTEPMGGKDKDYIRGHWEHVHEASGQPFDFSFFERDGFVYDTEPACRAIVTARKLDEQSGDGQANSGEDGPRAVPFLARVHQAFYAEGRDTTDGGELVEIAADFGYDKDAFAETWVAKETREETLGDFWFAQKSGITGFPTLLAVEDQQAQLVTAGFQKWENLAGPLEGWLSGGAQQS